MKKYGTKKLKKLMIGFRFYYTGHPVFDLDNLEKACEDSLKGFAYKDDNVQIIPKYKHTESFCVKENPRVELELEEIIEA